MSQIPGPSDSNFFNLRARPPNRDERYWRPNYRCSSSSSSNESAVDSPEYVPASQSEQLINTSTRRTLIFRNSNSQPPVLSTTVNSVSNTQRTSNTTLASQISSTNTTQGRIKWSYDMNRDLLHAYFKATEIETNRKGYLARLENIWNNEFQYSKFDGNKLGGQVRSVLKRNVITPNEIDDIKDKARRSLNNNVQERVENHPTQGSHDSQPVIEAETIDSVDELIESVLYITPEDSNCMSNDQYRNESNNETNDNDANEILNTFKSFVNQYKDEDVKTKPSIPKLQCNKNTLITVSKVNETLKQEFSSSQNLQQTHNLIYCAAITVCFLLNIKIRENNENTQMRGNQTNVPPWKRRLETKIDNVRSKIAVLKHYFDQNQRVSVKVKKKIMAIARVAGTFNFQPNFVKNLKVVYENFKQSVSAWGYRLRKYNKKVKRRNQNRLFRNNQKKFYETLSKENPGEFNVLPSTDSLFNYWNSIWGSEVKHSEDANWIKEEEQRMQDKAEMETIKITQDDVIEAVKYTANWKCAGPDHIQNFWLKHFSNCHQTLARQYDECTKNPSLIPVFFTEGRTFMIPKNKETHIASHFRPITCLPTMYKLLSSILKSKIYQHVTDKKILAEEQNGMKSKSRGSKELLTIDNIITKQAKIKMRNLSVGWIDYRKAYDSLPHSWLLKILSIYKIDHNIINFLKLTMPHWSTELYCKNDKKEIKTNRIFFKRGIYQGDPLSSLWFCLCLNPLSNILNTSPYGYKLNTTENFKITHLFYMDDLKIYASCFDHLRHMLELVLHFSTTIRMEFGLDKCNILNIKRGKVTDPETVNLSGGISINCLDIDASYKYLGLQQRLCVNDTNIKKTYETMFIKRVTSVLKTELFAKNKIRAINSWAIPLLMYTFGIISWSKTDLQALNRKVRTLLTKFRMHHIHSATERLYLPRRQGGRGLTDIEQLHSKQMKKYREYWEKKNTEFARNVKHADIYTPLKLSHSTFILPTIQTENEYKDIWKAGSMKGKYPKVLFDDPNVDKTMSTSYLTDGYLFPETEGFINAIQDQVIKTRNYIKYIIKRNIPSDLCRLCNQTTESIQHLIAGCSILAPKEYTNRHDLVGNIIHQELVKKMIPTNQRPIPHYLYKPDTVVENDEWKIYWNLSVITEHNIINNRPDMIQFDKRSRSASIIDMTVPLDENLQKAYSTKLTKYDDLKQQLRHMYDLTSVNILPIVISANGLVHRRTAENMKKLGINHEQRIIAKCQKSIILSTTAIVRKVLGEE